MNLGAPEILVILVVALLVFGPHKLPEIGRQVGGAMRELRKMQDSVKQELQTVMNEEQPRYDKPVSAALPTTPEAPVVDDAGDRGGRLDGRGTGPHRPTGAATSAGARQGFRGALRLVQLAGAEPDGGRRTATQTGR